MLDDGARPARPRRLGTVRSRLTLLATAVVAAVLGGSAVGLVTVQQRLLTHGIDQALIQRADNIQSDVMAGAFGTVLPSEGDREDSFLQLLDGDGRVVAASTNVTGMPAAAAPPRQKEEIRPVSKLPLSSHEFRVLARQVDSGSGTVTLVVAKNLDDVNESVRILTTSLALSIPAVVALLAALLWWLTGRVLRPVASIQAEVANIQGTDLQRRVSVRDDAYDEISRLARTMNAMLDRVQRAAERQRQFVADASHELRSPLTRIRTELEVGLAHPGALDPESTYRSVLSDTAQLQRLVEDLLFLARSEYEGLGRATALVDLDDLVLDEAQRLKRRGSVRVDATAVSAARVRGDSAQLARAIGNLASNAERHARSTVRFELWEHDGHSSLAVADDGRGIPVEHRATVFKRFTRLDEARSRDAGGSGLGLAIVQDIVVRHGGTITIDNTPGGGARLVMTFPRAD